MTPTVLESLSSAMSEDDATALEQAVEEQLAAEREAFEARFPLEAFTGIARALKVRPTPENLSRLSDRYCLSSISVLTYAIDTKNRPAKR